MVKQINKRGELFNSYMLIFFLAGILILGVIFFFIYTLIGVPIVSTIGVASNAVGTTFEGNQQLAPVNAEETIIPIFQAAHTAEWVGYAAMMMFFLGYFIMLFYVRTYPFLIFVWIALTVILVLLSIFVANAYDAASGQTINGVTYQSWVGNDYILSNLPLIIGGVGLMGGIILFVLVTRDSEAGLEI